MKRAGIILIIVLLGIGAFFLLREPKEEPIVPEETSQIFEQETVIGRSVEGRSITAHTFGNGTKHLLFVGGIHGGYEWNSVYLAYRMIDYLKENPTLVPENLKVTIVPSLNPDGVFAGIGAEGRFAANDTPSVSETVPGRLNANGIDLNRNFDCKWQPTSTWQGRSISAGTAAFSEPEAQAIRDFILREQPIATVFWHSQGNAVYASECEEGILPGTLTLMNLYADASGYQAIESFDAYPITGDAEGWLASIGIPAITVELATHETIEWEQNLAAFKALLKHYR